MGGRLRVSPGDIDPDIEVGCGARVSVVVDGVAADHQVLNFVRVQQPQKLFEVGW